VGESDDVGEGAPRICSDPHPRPTIIADVPRRTRSFLALPLGLLLVLLSMASACASVRSEGFARLPEAEKARFARYQQFMTERQQERFLLLQTQPERDAFIEAMKVEERLARFAPHVREAIWAGEVVPGMDADAVMLAWGPPERIERVRDPLQKGLPKRETWLYRGGKREAVFVEGQVIEVVP